MENIFSHTRVESTGKSKSHEMSQAKTQKERSSPLDPVRKAMHGNHGFCNFVQKSCEKK